jgi:ABC-type Na+ efflux pump permease subunit
MASPQAPSFGSSVAVVLKLSMVRLVRGRKLRLGVLAMVLVVLSAIAARYVAGENIEPAELVQEAVRLGFFHLLCYLLPYLFAAGAISEEAESRTLPYLLMRPISRVAMTLGKWLAAALTSSAVLVVGVLLLHVGAWATEPGEMIDQLGPTGKIMGALVLLSFLYSAICLFWGALVIEAGGVISILHMGALEFAFGKLPGPVRFVSMNYLATQVAGLPKGGFYEEYVPDVETWICIAVIVGLTLLFVGLSSLVTQISEFGFGKA